MPNQQSNVKFKFGSLAQYNELGLTGGVDPDTWYIITDKQMIFIGSTLYSLGNITRITSTEITNIVNQLQ